MMYSKRKEILMIFVPVFIICIWMSSYFVRSRVGQSIRLPIYGFDPRDLLSGHYLLYKVDYGRDIDCPENKAQPWCLCLFQGSEEADWSVSRQGECVSISHSCETLLQGNCTENGKFITGLERFYFPENYRHRLQTVPEKASIVVSLARDGKAVVQEMLVNGVPLFEWLGKAQSSGDE